MDSKFQLFCVGLSMTTQRSEMVKCDMSNTPKRSLEDKLRALIETVDAANAMTEPLTESIENLLRLSGASLHCEEVSILIRDGDNGDLRFLIAIGRVADQIVGMKVPSGMESPVSCLSGQPMAVTDVVDKFYAEVDKQTGYNSQTILATPLRHHDEIIGVLEFVNRVGDAPYEPFTPFEMDKAALFADAVASS